LFGFGFWTGGIVADAVALVDEQKHSFPTIDPQMTQMDED
jgi:hypothetical protein